MTSGYAIRPAVMADADTLVEFTLREAEDAEGVRAELRLASGAA